MGFWKGLKEFSQASERRKQQKQERAKNINQNPTEEELKNNKKGKLSILWTFLSLVVYFLAFGIIAMAFEENAAVGIFALLLFVPISTLPHRKAIGLAKEQRRINGKGSFVLFIACVLPLIVLVSGTLFFMFGWLYR